VPAAPPNTLEFYGQSEIGGRARRRTWPAWGRGFREASLPLAVLKPEPSRAAHEKGRAAVLIQLQDSTRILAKVA
jgi:hypothetical protein